MVKKIRFPLEMRNSVMVRTLEELKENFELKKIISHYSSGKLITWLNDRYYEEEVEQILDLDINSKDFNKSICKIFDVEYREEVTIDIEEIEKRNLRQIKLKQYTENQEIINSIDNVVFDQEELATLLDKGLTRIYLCGEKFTIPIRIENITYIGVNNPIAIIRSKELVNFESKKIVFKGLRYDGEYQKLVDSHRDSEYKKDKALLNGYKTSQYLDFMMNSNDIKDRENLFNTIVNELYEVTYDEKKYIKNKKRILEDADLVGIFDQYLNRIR